ncbi:hypothetical protein [Undibacterium sp. Ren11W]|uniref:hypothetical protein n=1 Tax=Undibacterium sp. Ren11W TaxID=3413045 RepID=UPI003BF3597B
MEKIKVIISFDIEFNINGAFSNPDMCSPLGAASLVRSHSGQEHGLGFALACLEQHQLRGTFFLETLCSHWFGISEMRKIAQSIAVNQHDLQLHLHPCWTTFKNPDWKTAAREANPNDSIANRTSDELREIIVDAKKLFVEITDKNPTIFRTGNLEIDREAFRIFYEQGLKYSSSLGAAGKGYADKTLNLHHGVHKIEGVTEIPVSCYFSQIPNKGWRLFTIPGSSTKEIEHLLDFAYQHQISPIVILVHASDFSPQSGHIQPQFKPNYFNQDRFNFLCSMLAENRDRFSTLTFDEFCNETPAATTDIMPSLSAPISGALIRILQNNVLPRVGIN